MNLVFPDSNRYWLVLLTTLTLVLQSCDYSSDKKIQAFTEQIKKERESLKKEREYVNYYLKSFLKIQQELGRIAEEKEVLVSPYMEEGREGRGEKILRYINSLENKITETQNTLSRISGMGTSAIDDLEKQIISFKSQLTKHKIEINDLKSNNYKLEQRVQLLSENLTTSYETIEEKENVIKQKNTELNKKYCFVIFKKDFVKVEIRKESINFDIKIKILK